MTQIYAGSKSYLELKGEFLERLGVDPSLALFVFPRDNEWKVFVIPRVAYEKGDATYREGTVRVIETCELDPNEREGIDSYFRNVIGTGLSF